MAPLHLLITAGPTHEPIDQVRFIGNRSSGRLGVALADEAARRGHRVTLLLGPVALLPADPAVSLHRFRTTSDLDTLMSAHVPACDALIMAAAVADFRPRLLQRPDAAAGKIKRGDQPLVLELEPTPDLLAKAASLRATSQLFVGFALEPRDRLRESALSKLERKDLDMVVANPLETMDADTIDATVFCRDGSSVQTDGPILKSQFAGWLLDVVQAARRR
ncbi:MAG: phosphopantothenoylcysteine decarboxylase [Phycisphaerales bacterium]